jgi:hypothetical protein
MSKKSLLGDSHITHGNDGITYRTTENTLDDGYTTYGSDGSSYKTTRNILDDGYTTQGSDGSTYKTRKKILDDGYITDIVTKPGKHKVRASSDGIGAGIGGGIILFLVALCVIHMCSRILTLTSIMLIAGVFIIPRFANICYGYGISTVWCSGVLFICTVFGLISSISNDVEVVLGTSRAGEGATVLMVMVLILLFSSIFAMNGLRDANLGFFAFLVLIISIPWCLLNVLTEVPNTNAMKLLSIVILFIIAIIDQILTTSKR